MVNDLNEDIQDLLRLMEEAVNKMLPIANELQKQVYDFLRREIGKFDTSDGKLVSGQDLHARIIYIQDSIENILGIRLWDTTITEFLSTFQTIQDRNIHLHRTYNQLLVDTSLLTPARRLIYEQAEYALKQGLATEYVHPVKFVLMQQVTSGASINDAMEMLYRWDMGELSNGKYTMDMPAPNLQKYAIQIARDSAYSVDRTISSIIKDKYKLDSFIYVGGIIKDSRPICQYLVSLNRDIAFDELSIILNDPDMQKGLIAGTDNTNFVQRCGGYNCRHKCFPVRSR